MAYLRVSFDNQEIDRRDLAGSVVIGRSTECDLAVHDILLSRQHCRIDLGGDGIWKGVDLSSKNGTLLNDQPLSGAVPLCDGDVVRLGRVRVRFFSGQLADAGLSAMRCPLIRPTDPMENLSATFVGYRYLEPGHATADCAGLAPRPSPKLPAAFERENIHSLLTAIASSSWDSIYAQARLPAPAYGPAEEIRPSPAARIRPRSPMDMSLQVSPRREEPVARPVPIAAVPQPRRQWKSIVFAVGMTVIFSLLIFSGGFSGLPNPTTPHAAMAQPRLQGPAIRSDSMGKFSPLNPGWSAAYQAAAATALPYLL
jgi:predicted component of type VI protein secretion system